MIKNILFKELKRNYKEFLIVGFALSFFIAISMAIYSSMKDNMSIIMELYDNIPESIQRALNFNNDQWSTILGFYASYFVYYVPMMSGIYAIYLGSKILSQEEQNKTAEFLLTRPVSRDYVISSKLILILFYITGINLLLYLTGLFSCGIITSWEININSLTVMHLYGLLVCIFFGVLGFFITVLMKRAKLIMGIAVGIVMGSYLIDMILRISDKAQFLLYITPFKYIDIDVMKADYGYEAWRILVMVSASAILVFLSFFFYRKKDILI